MRIIFCSLAFGKALFFLLGCCNGLVAQQSPSDPFATPETVNLFRNLKRLAAKGCMVGHQDALAYGVKWKYQPGRSDMKDIVGDYPAVYGWDLGNLELPNSSNNLDGVPFKKQKQFIREAYERGGVITLSWHANNPLTGGNAWDTTHGTVLSILPGGEKHKLFRSWLDKVAAFAQSLKGVDGKAIPVLFRPFHELTGTWFWWCSNNCTPEQFRTLWRFTAYYLREVKGVHNFLYVYNTADFSSEEHFLERYPGDDMVDLLSFDAYQYEDHRKNDWFIKNVNRQFSVLNKLSHEKNKLLAFGETGYEQIPFAEWWTQVLQPLLAPYEISYVLLWRNAGYVPGMKKEHYYAPYKGHISEKDFLKFHDADRILFEKDIASEKIYQ